MLAPIVPWLIVAGIVAGIALAGVIDELPRAAGRGTRFAFAFGWIETSR